jgi:hypothetical protein
LTGAYQALEKLLPSTTAAQSSNRIGRDRDNRNRVAVVYPDQLIAFFNLMSLANLSRYDRLPAFGHGCLHHHPYHIA